MRLCIGVRRLLRARVRRTGQLRRRHRRRRRGRQICRRRHGLVARRMQPGPGLREGRVWPSDCILGSPFFAYRYRDRHRSIRRFLATEVCGIC